MSKISVTIEDDVLELAREQSEGNLSAFVNDALRRHGRRAALRRLLDDLEAEVGPATCEELEEARRRWKL